MTNTSNPDKGLQKLGWLVVFLIALVASLGPLLSQRTWPGFFYAPFYTTNAFTDPTTPAWRVGLRPEDRVIGLNGERIERLAQAGVKGLSGAAQFSLVYELGRELAVLEVSNEPLGWLRLLEKAGPLVAAALALLGLGLRRGLLWGRVGALALVAALDYWLNPGAGRESGFDPVGWWQLGGGLLATAKWTTYLYWPLWTLLWASLVYGLVQQDRVSRRRKVALAVLGAVIAGQLGAYTYEAVKTATYNNPDYIIFHVRMVFWPMWGALLTLASLLLWQKRREWQAWAGWLGLVSFVAGYGVVTVFDSAWPGPGPQWYGLGLVLYGATAWTTRSNSAR